MKPKEPDTSFKGNSYLRYSGLAFQLAAVLFFSIFAGKWLDKTFNMSKPIFTMLLVLILFSGYMYKLYIELTRKQ